MKRSIVVVGAGIAGLAAAYVLKKEGHDPIVLERSERVGGRMISDVVNGYTIDCGAQFLTDKYPLLMNLIGRLGLSQDVVETSQYVGTVRKGKIRRVCSEDMFSPLKTGLLSLPAWLRFGLLGYKFLTKIKSLPLNDITAWSDYDDMDAETWSNSYFGDEITKYVMEPPNNGLFFQSLRDTSRVVPMVTTAQIFLKKARYTALRGGICVLPERLASELDVRLNAPVKSMSIEAGGIELRLENERIVADKVVLATTASAARGLYREPSAIERELLSTAYSSTLVIALAVKDTYRIVGQAAGLYGLLIPETERISISSMTIEGNKDKGRVGKGELLLAFLSDRAGSEMIDWKDDDILAVVLNEIEKYFVGVADNISFTRIYRWKEAMPMSPPGRGVNVARYRKSVNRATKVFLAGDYMGMPFTEGAAETGKWTAETLMRMT